MSSLETFLARIGADIDNTLDLLVPGKDVKPCNLHAAIRWSLFAGGKRVRPAILMAVGQSFGGASQSLMRTAAAVEMIHTYSLIHDDLPSMDDDDLRRGKAACHVEFGEATAILAGDVLQTLAFKAIAQDVSLTPQMRADLIVLLANASGTPNGMASGQHLDLEAEGQTLSIGDIEQIHRQKTGALMSAAAAAGAMIAGAKSRERETINTFASNIGLLFQITDDILDLTQETQVLGKTAGKDKTAKKATYPSIIGLERTRSMAIAIRDRAYDSLNDLVVDTTLLREFAGYIVSRIN